MRVGTLCYSTEQGLGYLAKAFYDNGVVTDPIIIRRRNREPHHEWYPRNTPLVGWGQAWQAAREMMNNRQVDVFLFFETPFDWAIIKEAQAYGVKTALMTMYECTPAVLPEQPDLILCPSHLDAVEFPGGKYIPVPVDVPWKERTKAMTFVHNAGWGGLAGRNGTSELVEAWNYVKSPAKLILRSQEGFQRAIRTVKGPYRNFDKRIDYRPGTSPQEMLYGEGDVFIFPEKFNGLSLPLQEAYASGMLVMAGNRFPMNQWLPVGPMIPVRGTRREPVLRSCRTVTVSEYDPKRIAATVDEWYGKDITNYSRMGKEWATAHSWERLKPVYLRTLQELLNGH